MEGTPQLSSFLFFFSLLIIKHLSAYISHLPFPILPNSPHKPLSTHYDLQFRDEKA